MRVRLLVLMVALGVTGVGLAAPGVAARQGALRVTLSTSDSQFDAGVDNQGWYSTSLRSRDANDNYAVGACFSPGLCAQERRSFKYRNFFTFDLSQVDQRVVAATLVLQRYRGEGNDTERLGLYKVGTGAQVLNDNRGLDRGIYRDLGSGDRYGSFALRTDGDRSRLVRLSLNQRAVRDINAAQGGFFSIGGKLLSARRTGPTEQYLFGFSRGRGVQDLNLVFG